MSVVEISFEDPGSGGPASGKRSASYWQPRCRGFRFRPVALRPRLSTGLPCFSAGDYATENRGGTTTLITQAVTAAVADKRNPIPLSELLAKSNPTLERLRQGVEAADRALVAARHNLAADVRDHVWGATLTEGHLTLLVDSAGWATRVRYAVPDLKTGVAAALGRPVEKVTVRVRPAGKA